MLTPVLADPAASVPLEPIDDVYALRTDRCIIEVSGRIGPLTAVRFRYKALDGTWNSAVQTDWGSGPAVLELDAEPVLVSPEIARRHTPVRRSMARTLHVAVTAPGGTSGPATVVVSDGDAVAWTFPSRLRVVSRTDDTVLVDVRGRLAPGPNDRRTRLAVWLRAAAEFGR